MRIQTLVILSALSFGGAAPAVAQNAMAAHDQMKPHSAMTPSAMKMSAADTRKMKACAAMTPAKMARNATCMKLTKAHSAMAAPSHGNMMSPTN